MFRVYASTDQRLAPEAIAAHARRAEALGYDGLALPEAVHDGIVAATLALAATSRIRVATHVLVAFPRSPTVTALAAWDLQRLSGGRFELGLGSQVRGNVVKRYGTSWSAPAPRMREYLLALRAIFERWQHGTPLRFEGEQYRITRMQPFFDPGPLPAGPPPLWLGAVGRALTAVAGEAADGLVTHPTSSHPRYLREVVCPRLSAGAERVGRAPDRAQLLVTPLCATGRDAAAVRAERESRRELLAFLFSTPAYWPSLELFGWRERGEALHALSRAGRWSEMPALLDDELLDTLVPAAPYRALPALLREAYAGLADGITLPLPDDPADDARVAEVIAALRT